MQHHPSRSRGTANPVMLFALASLTAATALIGACVVLRAPAADARQTQADPLVLYCAAGLREPVMRALQDYERSTGVLVDLHTHGSGTLFGQLITEARQGGGPDLYLSAEETWIQQGLEAGLLDAVIPLGGQRPVLIVRSGNPKRIHTLQDLLDDETSAAFGIGNQGTAIGGTTRLIATALGVIEPVHTHRKTEMENVVALASAVALGTLDAAIVWEITAAQTAGVEVVPLPASEQWAFDDHASPVSVAVTSTSGRPAEAFAVARYLGNDALGTRPIPCRQP